MDRLTAAILAASLGVTVGAATPSLLRAAGVALPSAAAPASAEPLLLPHRPPELLAHEDPSQPFDPDDDEAPVSDPLVPAQPHLDGAAGGPKPHGQLGLTRGPLVLHEQPAGAAPGVGDVEAGELVTILRVSGDWALVYHGGGDGLMVGWVKKSEIAIR